MPDVLAPQIPAGVTVLEASAGTGKSWTIAHLVCHFLLRGEVDELDQLVLASFTEVSAAELAGKVRNTLAGLVALLPDKQAPAEEPGLAQLLGDFRRLEAAERLRAEARLRQALSESERLLAGTIHSVFRRFLAEHADLCGVPAAFGVHEDGAALRLAAAQDAWRQHLAADSLAAELAVAGGWRLESDRAFVELAERRLDVAFAPDLDWPSLLNQLRQGFAELKSLLPELQAHLKEVEQLKAQGLVFSSRTPKAPPWERIQLLPERLASLSSGPPRWEHFQAARDLAILPQWFKDPAPERQQAWQALRLTQVAGAISSALSAKPGTQLVASSALAQLKWAWRIFLVKDCRARVAQALAEKAALDFDGILRSLWRALERGPRSAELLERLRERRRIAIVDESQDADPLQLQVFKKIFGDAQAGRRLVLVGDPKQSIYSFRGADWQSFVRAREAGGTELLRLDRNFRSAEGLLKATQASFQRAEPALGLAALAVPAVRAAKSETQLPLPDKGDPHPGARLVAVVVGEKDSEAWGNRKKAEPLAAAEAASALAELLKAQQGGQLVNPGQCAVLVASHFQADLVKEALRRRNIPAVIQKNGDVLKSPIALEWRTLLAAVLKPKDPRLRRAALATRLLGLDAGALAGLAEADEELWRGRLDSLLQAWEHGGLAGLQAGLDREAWGRPLARLAGLRGGERLVTDSRHLLELADQAARDAKLKPSQVLDWLAREAAAPSEEVSSEQRERRLERDGAAVKILTQWVAKGLQFDYCFVPFLWSTGRKPAKEVLEQGTDESWTLRHSELDPAGADAFQRAESAALQERLRLLYVALTRAQRRTWLLCGWIGFKRSGKRYPSLSALDWYLRWPVEKGQELEAWTEAALERKKAYAKDGTLADADGTPACGHAEALAQLQKEVGQPLLTVQAWQQAPAAPPYQRPAQEQAFPAAQDRKLVPAFKPWGITSFSKLTRKSEQAVPADMAPPEASAAAEDAKDSLPLAAFPRGKRPGNALHLLLEGWDLSQPLAPGAAAAALRAYGLENPETVALLEAFLPQLPQALLPLADRPSLGQAAVGTGRAELEFLLPLDSSRRLDGERLAELFAAHGDADFQAYAPALRLLERSALGGMLTGSLDRLLAWDGQWTVLDWKSNYLGQGRPQDYSREALWADAVGHHYLLQQLLYLVAARRYLRLRGRGERLVGAALAYLRGMQAGSERGLLALEPPAALLEALDGLFAPAGGSR